MDKLVRIYYGKYLDDINTEIPNSDILFDELGDIEHKIEPGEPNIPTAEEYKIPLKNLNEKGEQIYPYSFWEGEARSSAEGATQFMELFFRVEVLGKNKFLGIFKDVSYSEYDATCNVKISDLSFMLKEEQRPMLKKFELKDLVLTRIRDKSDTDGWNQLPQLKDNIGNNMEHESLTFGLYIVGGPRSSGTNRVGTTRSRMQFNDAFLDHLDIPTTTTGPRNRVVYDYDAFDVTRNTYIKIGGNTIFTKVRFWGTTSPPGQIDKAIYMSVYHNATTISDYGGDIVPMGRFFKNEDLDDLTEGEIIDVTVFDYDIGVSPEIVLTDNDLPAYRNFIFGCAYEEIEDYIQLDSKDYSILDVLDTTFRSISASVARRFTDDGFVGSIEVTSGSYSSSTGSQAEFAIVVNGPPSEDEYLVVRNNTFGETFRTQVLTTDTEQEIANKLQSALQNDSTYNSIFTFAVNSVTDSEDNIVGYEVRATTRSETDDYNGETITVSEQEYETQDGKLTGEYNYYAPSTNISYDPRDVTGGEDGYNEDDVIRVWVGGEPTAQTPIISADETAESIATIIKDAINDDSNVYSATVDGATVEISSSAFRTEDIDVDTGVTGVSVTTSTIKPVFELFETEKLLDRNRLAFFADPVMFGWMDKEIVEVLIGCAWQTSAYLYSIPNGSIAIHSRDYFTSLSDDMSDEDFDYLLKVEDMEVAGPRKYAGGYKTYEIDHAIDVLGINNTQTDDTTSVVADNEGIIDVPSNKHKKISSSNYRIANLGHPQFIEEAPDEVNILRVSPEDSAYFDLDHTLEDFLPLPSEQVVRFALSFDYPTIEFPVRLRLEKYPDIRVGDYVATEDGFLWLIKEMSIIPSNLKVKLSLEYKKKLNL